MDELLTDFAIRLREQLGERALEVACEQADSATGEVATVWQRVVDFLEKHDHAKRAS